MEKLLLTSLVAVTAVFGADTATILTQRALNISRLR